MREYVTLNFNKKNFGFKGLELTDFVLFGIGVIMFIIISSNTSNFEIPIFFLITYAFLLIPIQLSNKNRIYKILFMVFIYYLNKHYYIYKKNETEGVVNEAYQKFNQIKSKINKRIK